ncbi:MAG: T9SS type A sorting domain-containing protein [FCB group bacterium]|nr:T9SS type A sorting domain-containing protein [FCB group bacterium]
MSGPRWGAYSSNLVTGTVIDIMMRVWVTYPWGHPVIISDISRHCNTYSTTGPFGVTCHLEDDGEGITGDDVLELRYNVNGIGQWAVPLTDVEPLNDGIYGAEITGNFAAGDVIYYWIYTIDDEGLGNDTYYEAVNFEIIEPENPWTDLLVIDDYAYCIESYTAVLDQMNVIYEFWSIEENNGIDESVVNWVWENIIVIGWGGSTVPVLDESNVYDDFLNTGGHLCLIDQDYFEANGMPVSGTLEPGDFAYDYFGLESYVNDPAITDDTYYGAGENPITRYFDYSPYETYFDDSGIHLPPDMQRADYLVEGSAENIFWGSETGEGYGANYDNGYKTVFISFMAEAANEFYGDSVAVSEDFSELIYGICDWFNIINWEVEDRTLSGPSQFTLYPNHPNPFNAETTITFSLPTQSEIDVSIYNIEGKLVDTIFTGEKSAGPHSLKWDAGDLASGIYICRIETSMQAASQKILLLK